MGRPREQLVSFDKFRIAHAERALNNWTRSMYPTNERVVGDFALQLEPDGLPHAQGQSLQLNCYSRGLIAIAEMRNGAWRDSLQFRDPASVLVISASMENSYDGELVFTNEQFQYHILKGGLVHRLIEKNSRAEVATLWFDRTTARKSFAEMARDGELTVDILFATKNVVM